MKKDQNREFVELLAAAKQHVARLMDERGLTPAAGWRLHEETRADLEGTSVVVRPVHRLEAGPAHLRCTVRMDEATAKVSLRCECDPPIAPRD